MDYLNNKTIFIYVCIFIVIIFLFSLKTIALNIFYGTFVACVIIYCIHSKSRKNAETEYNIINDKLEEISDIANINILNNKELSSLLFSIKDIYYYNPDAYTEMMDALNNFTEIYEIIQEDKSKAGIYFDHMNTYKKQSLNALQSLIISVDNKDIIKKINTATNVLEDILLEYLNDVYHKNSENIHKTGYTTQTKIIELGPNPINSYSLDSNKDNIISKYSYNIF